MTVSLHTLGTKVIALDIEGTTTPVDFVYKVLFPFARAHVTPFLKSEGQSPACQAALSQLRAEYKDDRARGMAPPAMADGGDVVPYVHWLMDQDRKSPGLKALQGLIWQDGYQTGELRGEVYPDVPPALSRWKFRGLDVYIYSSGSVLAQQLLFRTTEAGDLTKQLRGYFDTGVGPKTSTDSYRRIVEAVGVPSASLLFVSDVIAELDAARSAGLQTALCVRGAGRGSTPASSHPVVRTFDDVT